MSTLYGLYMMEAWNSGKCKTSQLMEEESKLGTAIPKKKLKPVDKREAGSCRKLRVHGRSNHQRKEESSVPEIRLAGQWLTKIGFSAGQLIRISTSQGKIVIEPDDTG